MAPPIAPKKTFPTLLDAAARTVAVLPEFRLQIRCGRPVRERGERLDKIVVERKLQIAWTCWGKGTTFPTSAKAGLFVSSSLTEGCR